MSKSEFIKLISINIYKGADEVSTKGEILFALESSKEKWITGETLAKQLNISRTAIWKAVNTLKQEGYKISSVTKKGYCLLKENDIISVEGISQYLDDKAIAKKINIFKTIGSTNVTAKKLAVDGATHGTVVISEEQTKGRGRLGRTFYSPASKGIYLSIILRPKFSISNSVLITTAASVAVCHAIMSVIKCDPKIKWVNDIYIENKKVCGIMTEAITDFESGEVDSIILGIGINFSTSKTDFPKEIQDIAGSLMSMVGKCNQSGDITRNQLVAKLINNITNVCDMALSRNHLDEYKMRSTILNQKIEVHALNEVIEAFAIDINDNGGLIIRTNDGEVSSINSGDVSIKTVENNEGKDS